MAYMKDKKGRRLDSFAVDGAVTSSPWKGSPVANEAAWADGQWTNVYASNSRKRYIANRDSGFVRLVYAAVAGSGDGVTAQPFVIRASVESPASTMQRVLFSGKRDAIVSPGGIVVSDPLYVKLTAGQQFWVRTHTAGAWVFNFGTIMGTIPAWGEGCDAGFNSASSDKTLTGTVGTGASSHISPIAVIGDAGFGLPFVYLTGDSIMAGLGDSDAVVDAGRGFGRRAMNNTVPFVNTALSGDNLTSAKPFRYQLTQGCTDALTNMGINDIKGGGTLATVQANMLTAWAALGANGAKVWQTTITPYTTSTDNWATVGNQTVSAYETVRVGINNWIRDGAPISAGVAVAVGAAGTRAGAAGHPLTGYFETADAVETARNSGKWKVGMVYLTDTLGLHPNSAGNAALAAPIDITKFGK